MFVVRCYTRCAAGDYPDISVTYVYLAYLVSVMMKIHITYVLDIYYEYLLYLLCYKISKEKNI